MSPAPRMTTGLTTYGNGRGSPDAFDDLLGQNFPDFDFVAGNNCSTDELDKFPFGDPIVAIGRFIVVRAAFLVRVGLGARRRQIGARYAGSTCAAAG